LILLDQNNNECSILKKVCWDIEKRGAVGETPLHICVLVGSKLHLDLAKRLIKLFPCLANDIALGDEYYGL
jgi:ankyrin repeat protein